MAPGAIIFACANPTPQIWPDAAHAGRAMIVATGRSDFPDQINNPLVFPGLFGGTLGARARA
jgi:malate dehydrogenase (oxaloacetate-decarboxylating)